MPISPESAKLPNAISLDRFRELADGEREGLLELLQLYITKTEEQIQDIEKALKAKAYPEIARLAHSMVGANAMVGLDSVVPGLRKLEELAEIKDLTEVRQTFDNVHQELDRIQTALKQYVQTLTSDK